jgi:putative ATPase
MTTPLAIELRPKRLDEIIGQHHLLDPGAPLRKMAEKKLFQSTILWGPPGTGKTSIVRALAKETESDFRPLNATNASIKELRSIVEHAAKIIEERSTFVFVDEIHRWNKAQQDVMLPSVEEGIITLFGATTEKPKFAVNSTILSRCLILETKPLEYSDLIFVYKRVIAHYKKKGRSIKPEKEASKRLLTRCGGDARKMVMALETLIEIMSDDDRITANMVDTVIPDKHLVFDARGNEHFDLAHCYQEAIQHSQVDDAIYWLAKWLVSGEDPAYIARRMLITAFEDCAGNPFAATTAMAAAFATERTGMPECRIPLALATVEMATSKRNKSAYFAIKEAMSDVENGETVHVPPSLRAGTTGYHRVTQKTYVKGFAKDWAALVSSDDGVLNKADDSPHRFMYAIQHPDGGMVDGPTPFLEKMLERSGDDGYRIVQLSREGEPESLYEWGLGNWDPIAGVTI